MIEHPRPSRSHPRLVTLMPSGRVLVSSRLHRHVRRLPRPPLGMRRWVTRRLLQSASPHAAAPATRARLRRARSPRAATQMHATSVDSNDRRSSQRGVLPVPALPAARQEWVTSHRRDVEVVRRHPCALTELADVRGSPDHGRKRAADSQKPRESCGRRDGVWMR